MDALRYAMEDMPRAAPRVKARPGGLPGQWNE